MREREREKPKYTLEQLNQPHLHIVTLLHYGTRGHLKERGGN